MFNKPRPARIALRAELVFWRAVVRPAKKPFEKGKNGVLTLADIG
jgi:hypothetical protein